MIIPCGFVELPVLHPITVLIGINSFFSFATIVIPLFFGTHFIGLIHELSDIGYMIPASNHLMIFFFTTSFIMGFSLLCCSTELL